MGLNASNVRAERAKLIHDLRDVCEQQKVTIDDAMILKLLDMCQRSLVHLELPERAAMQVVIGAFEEGARILEMDEPKLVESVTVMRATAKYLKTVEQHYG